MNESTYQHQLIKKLQFRFPGCFVLRNDPRLNQGIPDLLMLYGNHWVMLEVKISPSAPTQPNQEHYVELFNDMSYCRFIFPENEAEVLDELQATLGSCW